MYPQCSHVIGFPLGFDMLSVPHLFKRGSISIKSYIFVVGLVVVVVFK